MARGKKDESSKAKPAENTKQNPKKRGQTTKKSDAAASKEAKGAAGTAKKVEGKSKKPDAAASKSPRLAKWEEPENQVLLEGWARKGLSMEQIAHNMGISKQTLYRWQEQSCDICDAIKKGKEVTNFMVENALFTAAIGGNVVAQIFWLKNRMPECWQDKIEQKIEADVEHTGGLAYLAPRLEVDDG